MNLDELARDAVRELKEARQQATFTSRPPGERRPRGTATPRRRPAWAYAVAGFVVAVAIGATSWVLLAGGEPAAPARSLSTFDRWGLSGVDLPSTADQIGMVFDAMPTEVAGHPRADALGDGEHGVEYGEGPEDQGFSMSVQQPEHRMDVDGRLLSPAGWFRLMATAPELTTIAGVLDDDMVWLHFSTTGEDGTEYHLVWGRAEGDWSFVFDAWSQEDLDALVEAFIATNATVLASEGDQEETAAAPQARGDGTFLEGSRA